MKFQSKSTLRLLQTSLLIALFTAGFTRASAATASSSADTIQITGQVSTATHFIYPGAGIGGIGDDE